MTNDVQTPQAVRADAFEALEDDMAIIEQMANATSFVTEALLVDRAKPDQSVSMSSENARMLDFMIHELIRQVRTIEAKWGDAHNAACDAERAEDERERER